MTFWVCVFGEGSGDDGRGAQPLVSAWVSPHLLFQPLVLLLTFPRTPAGPYGYLMGIKKVYPSGAHNPVGAHLSQWTMPLEKEKSALPLSRCSFVHEHRAH